MIGYEELFRVSELVNVNAKAFYEVPGRIKNEKLNFLSPNIDEHQHRMLIESRQIARPFNNSTVLKDSLAITGSRGK